MHIVTLTTCHNRRSQTLLALGDLHAQALPEGWRTSHILVDDGSCDGTAEAVHSAYPEVEIIDGDGGLFWAGGMRRGWDRAARHRHFDYLFAYNDDARFEPFALADLVAAGAAIREPHVVAGSFRDADGAATSYGGRRRSSRLHPLKFATIVEPDGSVQDADTLNMNAALISRAALDQVGFLSDFFVHSGADFEFGIKLRKAGGRVLVAPRHIGCCTLNPQSAILPGDEPGLGPALAMLLDRKREPPGQRFAYYRRHGGWLWPVRFVIPYVTIWFRQLALLRRFGPAMPGKRG